MGLERFRRLILKQWSIIAVCVLFTGIGAALATQLMTKLYESQVRVQVDFPATDASIVLGVDHLVTTEVQEATSRAVLSQVAAKYPGLTYGQLSGEVTAAAFTGSQLFTITVLDRNPARAASLANDIANTLITNQRQVLAADNMQAQQQVSQSIASTQAQLATATANLASLKAKNAGLSEVAAAQATVDSLQTQLTQLGTTQAAIQQAQARKANFLHVADPATPSATPKRPYLLLNLGVGLGAGLVLGLLAVALLDLLNQRVRSARDVLALLEWPVLGEVAPQRGDREPSPQRYQDLLTNLAFYDVERPLRSLCVASATQQEDAKAVAAELALVTAVTGKRTLLVDADLARPSQAERFGIHATTGLSTAILDSHAAQGGAIQLEGYMFAPVSVQAPMLRVVPAGPTPPNPYGLLKSRATQQLVRAMAQGGADLTIFSAPPLLKAPGTAAFAAGTDGVLVVVDVAGARKDQLLRMKALLAETGTRVLGCVVQRHRPVSDKQQVVVRQAPPAFVPQPGAASMTGAPTGVPQPRT